MTVKQFRKLNPDTSFFLRWASNAHSFGPKGGSVYGDSSDCIIVRIEKTPVLNDPECLTLYVWHPLCCDPLE